MNTALAIIEQTEHLTSDYTIKDGIIQDPGKFEGEWYYSLYFYDCIMSGGGDEIKSSYLDSERIIDVFNLTHSERDAFPELGNANRVECQESDNGFFYCDARV